MIDGNLKQRLKRKIEYLNSEKNSSNDVDIIEVQNQSDLSNLDGHVETDNNLPLISDTKVNPEPPDNIDNIDYSQYKDSKGHFLKGFPGGPGRGHKKNTENTCVDSGEGDDEDLGLLSAFHRALKRHGVEKFCLDLLKKSPVSAAQLLMNLKKFEGLDGEGNITIVTKPGFTLPCEDNKQSQEPIEQSKSNEQSDIHTPIQETEDLPIVSDIQPKQLPSERLGSAFKCIGDGPDPGWTRHTDFED